MLNKAKFIRDVIPAEAGIQSFQQVPDSGFRRSDDFLRRHQGWREKIMKQKISIFILIIFCITAVSFSAIASSNRVALIIGNSAYKSAPLANPANDANDMATVLKRLGFDVIKKVNADQRQMKNAINKFHKGLRESEIGLFYSAGHGMQIDNANYLYLSGQTSNQNQM